MERQKSLAPPTSFGLPTAELYHPPVALILWPTQGLLRDITLVVLGSLFVALAAQVAIPLPQTVRF
jgi:biotin transport system substrate-specific component